MRVVQSVRAQKDLWDYAHYLSQQSEQALDKFLTRYDEVCDSLTDMPERCPRVEVLPDNFHHIGIRDFNNHRVVYSIDGEVITIYWIVDTRQDPKTLYL